MAVKELDVESLVGMDLPAAKKLIFSKGWRFHLLKEDGRVFESGKSLQPRVDRILLSVASSIVTDAIVG